MLVDYDGDGGRIHCIGRRCFVAPYKEYTPPKYYPVYLPRGHKVGGRDYAWKLSNQLRAPSNERELGFSFRTSLVRAFALPELAGLSESGRWKWQGVPLTLLIGLRLDRHVSNFFNASLSRESFRPIARLHVLTPIFGRLALRPNLTLAPTPTLSLSRTIYLGRSSTGLKFGLKIGPAEGGSWRADWSMKLTWHPSDSAQIVGLKSATKATPAGGAGIRYERTLVPSKNSKLDVGLSLESGGDSSSNPAPFRLILNKLKLTNFMATEGRRTPPKRPSTYLKASHAIGQSGTVTVLPGHWIDPGGEPGAPGEREFNMEVANAVEKRLHSHGWKVLRPDREAPHLKWVQYLNWVSTQTLNGSPVLEIHGQGSMADHRGYVLGVLGEKEAPLNKELAKHFGTFPMSWMELAVPRRGGVLLECFNSDEVMKMAPWHRRWAVSQLASTITSCFERVKINSKE